MIVFIYCMGFWFINNERKLCKASSLTKGLQTIQAVKELLVDNYIASVITNTLK